MTLRLFTRYQNSAGQRVRIALNLKGLDYDYVAVTSPQDPDYLAINPQGLIPVLVVDGTAVAQSLAIIDLIEDLHPEPALLPDDPLLRAQVRGFAQLITSDLHPINNNRVRRYLTDRLGVSTAAMSDWYAHWLATAFKGLEAQLAAQPPNAFGFGASPGLAEICLVPQMDNARRFGCDLGAYPKLVRVDAACREFAAFARAAPDQQPDYPGP